MNTLPCFTMAGGSFQTEFYRWAEPINPQIWQLKVVAFDTLTRPKDITRVQGEEGFAPRGAGAAIGPRRL